MQILRKFVDAHRGTFGVEPICKVMQVSPSGYRLRWMRPVAFGLQLENSMSPTMRLENENRKRRFALERPTGAPNVLAVLLCSDFFRAGVQAATQAQRLRG